MSLCYLVARAISIGAVGVDGAAAVGVVVLGDVGLILVPWRIQPVRVIVNTAALQLLS